MRLKLAATLRGIVCQSLVPKADGTGRVCIQEIMVNTPFVASLIQEGSLDKIDDAIRDGAQYGMVAKNHSLFAAWERGDISKEDAIAFSNRPTDLELAIRTREFERRNAAEKKEDFPPPLPPSPSKTEKPKFGFF